MTERQSPGATLYERIERDRADKAAEQASGTGTTRLSGLLAAAKSRRTI